MVLPDKENSLVEDDEIPFKCDICNLGFIRKDILDKHKSAVHESARKSSNIQGGNYTSVLRFQNFIEFLR